MGWLAFAFSLSMGVLAISVDASQRPLSAWTPNETRLRTQDRAQVKIVRLQALDGMSIRHLVSGKRTTRRSTASPETPFLETFGEDESWTGFVQDRSGTRVSGRWTVEGSQLCVYSGSNNQICRPVYRAHRGGKVYMTGYFAHSPLPSRAGFSDIAGHNLQVLPPSEALAIINGRRLAVLIDGRALIRGRYEVYHRSGDIVKVTEGAVASSQFTIREHAICVQLATSLSCRRFATNNDGQLFISYDNGPWLSVVLDSPAV